MPLVKRPSGQTAHTAFQCLVVVNAHMAGRQAKENTTLTMTTARGTAMLRGTAGFRTPDICAKILVGGFAAKINEIILPLERLGPKDHIVFSGKVDNVLQVLPQVGNPSA